MEISAHHPVSRFFVSTELARVQINLEIDLVLQELKFYAVLIVWLLSGVCNVLSPDRLKLGLDNYHLREGSRIKLDMSSNLIALFEGNYKLGQILVVIFNLFHILNNLYFSTLGAKDFWTTIKERWEKLRREPSSQEQAWLIPQPGRNTWGDSGE